MLTTHPPGDSVARLMKTVLFHMLDAMAPGRCQLLPTRLWPAPAVFVLLLLLTGMAGCAMAPAQEMSDARLALQAARVAGAERHAVEWLHSAEELLGDAEHAIGGQRFGDARDRARAARGIALAARNVALVADGIGIRAEEVADTRTQAGVLVDASRRAMASGDAPEAVRLAEEAARVSQQAADAARPLP